MISRLLFVRSLWFVMPINSIDRSGENSQNDSKNRPNWTQDELESKNGTVMILLERVSVWTGNIDMADSVSPFNRTSRAHTPPKEFPHAFPTEMYESPKISTLCHTIWATRLRPYGQPSQPASAWISPRKKMCKLAFIMHVFLHLSRLCSHVYICGFAAKACGIQIFNTFHSTNR